MMIGSARCGSQISMRRFSPFIPVIQIHVSPGGRAHRAILRPHRKEEFMKHRLLAAAVSAVTAFCVVSGSAGAARGAVEPSRMAAIAAVRHVTGPIGPMTCISPGGSGTIWSCDFARGHASVTFDRRRAFAAKVYVTCKIAGANVRIGCR